MKRFGSKNKQARNKRHGRGMIRKHGDGPLVFDVKEVDVHDWYDGHWKKKAPDRYNYSLFDH